MLGWDNHTITSKFQPLKKGSMFFQTCPGRISGTYIKPVTSMPSSPGSTTSATCGIDIILPYIPNAYHAEGRHLAGWKHRTQHPQSYKSLVEAADMGKYLHVYECTKIDDVIKYRIAI
jgi:hypothetical protein